MANVVAPMGFVPVRGINTYQGQTNIYYIPSTDTNQYSIGDAVKSVVGADTANGFPCVTKSTGAASEYQRGVIVAVLPVPAVGTPSLIGTPLALENIGIPATKTQGYYVEVADDPNQLFELQDDGLSGLTAAAASKNAGFTPTNPTSPLAISATVLTTSTVATTATLPLKMMGLSQRPAPGGGNSLGANARWIVKFNLHELSGSGVAGA
ncbi:hypothetical protein H0X91_18055 [Burkholderia sp. 9777_1386]|uniref:hypothetical protein n=1 Tax=Burkholderia sp. 9777_1386 TaxID=2751183 RepID=UPI0018C44B61|nr:hypothetical protein [Burkholderia sp. 9777_1386]MBG0871875.1 hypothetical protein [Burkholderia sp. 9777_1386]